VNELTTGGVQGKGDELIRLVSSADSTVQLVCRSGLARTVEQPFVSFNVGAGGVGGGAASGKWYKEAGTSSTTRFIVHPDGCPLDVLDTFQQLLRLSNGPQVLHNNDITRGETTD
jgi:hypothetical protein